MYVVFVIFIFQKHTTIMKKLLLSAMAALCILTGFAQEPYPQITNIPGRSTVCLDGNWKYIVDLYKTGNQDYRANPLPEGQRRR